MSRPVSNAWTLVLFFSLAVHMAGAKGAEFDFVYVDDFPEVSGVAEQSIDLVDPGTGLRAHKTVYVAVANNRRLLTSVVSTHCGTWVADDSWNVTLIVAQQILPAVVTSSEAAEARNRFFAVFARDQNGRIRRYEDLTVIEVTELTRRVLPMCPGL